MAIAMLLVMASSAAAFTITQSIGDDVDDKAWRQVGTAWFAQVGSELRGSFTARSVFTLGAEADTAVECIYPVVLSTDADFVPDALRLVLRSDSWFGWSLSLESDTGLVPPGGSQASHMGRVSLPPGTYVTLLSYDPLTGGLSLSIDEVLANKKRSLYQKAIEIATTDRPLWLGAGLDSPGGDRVPELVSFEALGALGYYMPVSARFAVGASSADGGFLPLAVIDADEEVAVRLSEVGICPPGQFELAFRSRDGLGETTHLVDADAISLTQLPGEKLPLGEVEVRLDYKDGHEALMTATRVITVGQVRIGLGEVRVDRQAREVLGSLHIATSAGLGEVGVMADALLYEEVWNPSSRKYDSVPYEERRVLDGAVTFDDAGKSRVDFRLPLPQKAGLFRMRLRAEALAPKLAMALSSEEALFTTYAPAMPKLGQPYAIAVLPDTQYYARSYPVIFRRQIQYLAEQAAERNIVLALHVGDITDNNSPMEWERAAESMKLLDGVMPFVLSQGNHDLNSAGNATNRESTLMDSVFPVIGQPWLKGTFPEGQVVNSYATFDFAGDRYLVISLEFGPRDEALEWANAVVEAHPDHSVIVVTHAYTHHTGARSNHAYQYPIASSPATTVNGADQMWRKLISRHANMLMVVSGHHSDGLARRVSRGQHGNAVYEIMANFQFGASGGGGYFPLFEFHPDGSIEVYTYSPYFGEWRTGRSAWGFSNHFMIDRVNERYVDLECPE